MTCIVGLKSNNKVYIGADGAGVASDFSFSKRSHPKVFIRTKDSLSKNINPMIFGFTSSFRMGQLLQYSLKIPAQKPKQSDMSYLVTDFVNAVKSCFNLGGYGIINGESDNTKDDSGGTFILGYKKSLYEIYDDFQISEVFDDYVACGCGYSYSLGSLFSTKEFKMTPNQRITTALEAATAYSAGVSDPYTILNI